MCVCVCLLKVIIHGRFYVPFAFVHLLRHVGLDGEQTPDGLSFLTNLWTRLRTQSNLHDGPKNELHIFYYYDVHNYASRENIGFVG